MYFKMKLREKIFKFFRLVLCRFAYPPKDITIEISTKCALKCRICFRFPLSINEKTMKWELFKTILNKIKSEPRQNISYLNFVGLGEVFCHDRLLDVLKYTRELFPDISINLSTSLVPFKEEVLKQIIEHGLVDQMNISLDDAQPCSEDFHPCTNETLNNIDRLLEMIHVSHSKMIVRFQGVLLSTEQVQRILDFAKAKGVSFVHFIRMDLHAFKGETDLSRIGRAQEIQLMRWVRRYGKQRDITVTHNNSFNIFMRIASHFDKYCLMTDDHMFIDVEGNVLPCFFLRKHVFGDLKHESLQQIYARTPKLSFYSDQEVVCKGCDEYKENYHHKC